ncbi:hypothetical protein [Streptomyces sp. KS 21]|uniref:hypothetical protein n=1 Tax=Streptomyces sp. KS 21 TaxID=2485150 RepID=UPI00141524D8
MVVVAGELLQVGRFAAVPGFVELGSVLDLVLGPVDVDLFLLQVDHLDRPGGQQHVLPEDPYPGVHDDAGGADLLGMLADLAVLPSVASTL